MFVCSVHSATSAVLAVVGDGRSGDPLHERDDKRDVYEGEVSEVDTVSELVRRVDGVVMACVRSLTLPEVRRAVSAATSLRKLRNGLPILPYVSITSGMNSLCTAVAAALYLLFLSVSRLMMGSLLGAELPWRGRGWKWLTAESMMWVMETSARIVMPVSRRPSTRMSGRRLLVLPFRFVVPGISPMGSVTAQLADCLNGEFYLVVCLGLVASCVAGVDAD